MAVRTVPQKLLHSLVPAEITQMSVFTSLGGTCVPAAWASLWEVFAVAGTDGRMEGQMERGKDILEASGWLSVAGAGSAAGGGQALPATQEPAARFMGGYLASRLFCSFISSEMDVFPKDNLFKAVLTGFQLLFITLVFRSKNFSANIESISRTRERGGFFPCCSISVR